MNKTLITLKRNKLLVPSKLEKSIYNESQRRTAIINLTDELRKIIPNVRLDKTLQNQLTVELVEQYLIDLTGVAPHFLNSVEFKTLSAEIFNDNILIPHLRIEDQTEKDPIITLESMNECEFFEIPRNIMSSINSVDKTIIAELEWFLVSYPSLDLPSSIPFKEIQCIVMEHREDYKGVSSINDFLRLGIYKLGGDPSLIKIHKELKLAHNSAKSAVNPGWRNFKSMPRKNRRQLLSRIENYLIENPNLANHVTDSFRCYGSWLVLSERLHPGDYFRLFPKTAEFFKTIKDKNVKKNYKSWYSKLREMYDSGKSVEEISTFLAKRPGEFIRRIDSLIRRSEDMSEVAKVLDIFIKLPEVSSKTVLELSDYYARRSRVMNRLVTVNEKKVRLIPLPAHSEEFCKLMNDTIIRKLFKNITEKAKELDDLSGKLVYLDKELLDIPIPKDMRFSNVSLPRGSKIKIPETDKIIRMYIHWIQGPKETEDIDLHAHLVNLEKGTSSSIGYNSNIGGISNVAAHSGDVINREGDCSEFIDIDIDKAIEAGYTTVIMDIRNFKNRGFDTLPCWAGYCTVPGVEGKNLTWFPTPNTSKFNTEINSKTSTLILALIDLVKRKVKIIDVPMTEFTTPSGTSIETSIAKFYSVDSKINAYEVFKFHYEARGAVIVDEIPEQNENECLIITQSDISSDYTKLLSIL